MAFVCAQTNSAGGGRGFHSALRDFPPPEQSARNRKNLHKSARGLRALQSAWVSAQKRKEIVFAPRGDSRGGRSL